MWNVQGLNTSEIQKKDLRVMKSHNPTICMLVETKVKEENKNKILTQSFGV